ncbi:hypothetical protein ACJX0J_003674 [Zea mays]
MRFAFGAYRTGLTNVERIVKAVLARERTQSSLPNVESRRKWIGSKQIPDSCTLLVGGHGFLFLEVECRLFYKGGFPVPVLFECHYFKCFEMDIFEKGNGMVKPELLEERIFNSITWAPRIWVGPLGQSI